MRCIFYSFISILAVNNRVGVINQAKTNKEINAENNSQSYNRNTSYCSIFSEKYYGESAPECIAGIRRKKYTKR